MQILTTYQDQNGWWTYDNQLSKEDWVSILSDMMSEKPDWIPYLQRLYLRPEHTSICGELDKLMNRKIGSTSSVIMHIGRYAENKKGEFQVVRDNESDNCYWIIPVLGMETSKGFTYCLRQELIDAMIELDIADVFEVECVRFKQLLEYFVSHLEYVENSDTTHVGYAQYIQPIKNFAKEGTGWRGEHIPIQKQILKWSRYECSNICINISNHYGKGYYTRKCYLNWASTGINVNANWDDSDHIKSLRLEHYYEDDKSYDSIGKPQSLENLGLFDSQKPNQTLKDFYRVYRDTYIEECKQHQNNKAMNKLTPYIHLLKNKKNLILQGAPGSGKTYSTAALALAVLEAKGVDYSDRASVMAEYKKMVEQKRIFFTTFHQSMDYEDFIEGLKPEIVKDEDNKTAGVTYEVKDGIFKQACQSVGLGGMSAVACVDKFIESVTGKADENATIIKTISGKSEVKVWHVKGNTTLVVRSVNSTSKNGDSPLNIEKIRLQANEDGKEPNWESYAKAVIKAAIERYGSKDNNSVVLIIDEINRGNISKIFGELITLLEADKREGDGNVNAITLTLPYSKEQFSVPSNLYIIGTMNTTDRSTGSVDYAIRRRFAFATLKAQEELITDENALVLFKAVKKFIVPIDPADSMEDLMVGHSYFMSEDLVSAWKYEIYPLLMEYYKDGLIKNSPKEYSDMDKFIEHFGE